jgi:branched-chain amino acid transport system substrate-binding protein
MNMPYRNFLKTTWLILLLALLLLGGCQSGGSGGADAGTAAPDKAAPYKLGAVLSITGGASLLGTQERNTLKMIEAQIQKAGGIQGPDGLYHPLEIVIYDTGSDESKAVLAAKKLIGEDNVLAILGASQSGETMAIMDTVQKAGVPLISPASSMRISEPVGDRKWVFKTSFSDRHLALTTAQFLADQGWTKIGWLSVNTAWGDSGKTEFEAAAKKAGITILASEKFEAGDTDLTAQLTKIRGTNPQALLIWAIMPGGAIATKNAHDLSFKMPIVSVGATTAKYLELATKEAAEGVYQTTGKLTVNKGLPDTDPQKKPLQKFISDYQALYGAEPESFAANAYDACQITMLALKKAGADRSKIRDELENVKGYMGMTGEFSMSPQDHDGFNPNGLVIVQVKNGTWQVVK